MSDVKKVAIFATGWGEAVVEEFISGIMKGFSDTRTDLYFFMCYATPYNQPDVKIGELNIFNLPDLANFDGAIIYGNSLDFEGVFDSINERCQKAGIPAVCTGKRGDNICYIGADNTAGTVNMVTHLLDVHHLTDFFFIGGSPDNSDSEERRIALVDTLKSRGIELKDDHCITTYWAPEAAEECVQKIHDSGTKMPEVFVCANDILAMATCNSLNECGYKVPEEVKVTGFDHEFFARIFDPAISSVDQATFDKGIACADVLINAFNGKDSPAEQIVPCKFIPLESCGCTNVLHFENIRRRACKGIFTDHMRDQNIENELVRLERKVMEGDSYADLYPNLKEMYEGISTYVGNSFHIVLEPLFGKSITNSSKTLRTNGYSRIMDAIFSMEHGKVSTNPTFDTSKLVPVIEDDGINRFFLFLPLHDGKETLGYMILCDDPDKISNYNRLNKYATRLDNTLAKFRQTLTLNRLNAKLKEISETDPLTRVRNRSAFENREAEIDMAIKNNIQRPFGIAMFDINNLKPINDKYGHDIGDNYIKACCKMLCNAYKKSPVYRIGGDEFLALLFDSDFENRDILLMELRDKMDLLEQSRLPITETLSVASGLSVYDPEKDSSVADVFKRADEAMYENKKYMKSRINIR